MSQPKVVWRHTHNGENGEQLFLLEGKYFTRFAFDNFLEAYKGAVTPVRLRGGSGTSVHAGYSPYSDHSGGDLDLDFSSLFDDEPTLPGVVSTPGPGGWTMYVTPVKKDGDD